jgi:hypothetical protein
MPQIDEMELLAISTAIDNALDALESDNTHEQRQEAFSALQDLYEPGTVLGHRTGSQSFSTDGGASWSYTLPSHKDGIK